VLVYTTLNPRTVFEIICHNIALSLRSHLTLGLHALYQPHHALYIAAVFYSMRTYCCRFMWMLKPSSLFNQSTRRSWRQVRRVLLSAYATACGSGATAEGPHHDALTPD